MGFPIRKSSDQRVFAPPRRLSQRITSFIACACQGIHQLPLRHLIVHIANTHPRQASNDIGNKKDQLLEICSMARLGKPIICAGLSVPCDVATSIITRPPTKGYGPFRVRLRTWNPNKSSLYDVIQNRHRTEVLCKLVFLTNDAIQSTRHQWWSWTGSNRRPPACKAGALPAELQPLIGVKTIGGPG